jgi:23S rRNA pseudouridine1911/1915/1917 synthase
MDEFLCDRPSKRFMKNPSFSVLYQDNAILVAEKPAGLLTIPDRYSKDEANLKDLAAAAFGQVRVVHRIDRETSGVVILARTEEAHAHLNQQFEVRSVQKKYLALSRGTAEETEFTIDRPLRLDADRQHRTVVDAYNGKESTTHIRILERFRHFVFMECMPETGRTHQIRVHLSEHGLPIVADDLYGNGKGFFLSEVKSKFKIGEDEDERPILSRLALHASVLEITHPETGARMRFESLLPKDIKAAVNQLKKHAPFRGMAF